MARSSKKSYEIDMCNGPILPKLLRFSVPLTLSTMLQLLFNAADVVVVGRYAGDNSLAAVGSNTALINLLTNLFLGLSIGANILAARHYGAREDEELSKTVHTSILLSIYSGILLSIVGVCGARVILEWMQCPDDVLGLATIYRQLEKLEAAGAVHKVNTEEGALYQYCGRQSQGHRDCFLLKCERCGRIRHLDCSHLKALYDHLERNHHFHIDPCGTLFTGLCELCVRDKDFHGTD